MELKKIVDKYKIIGVISSYQSSLKNTGTVKDLNIKNLEQALKMVGLSSQFIDKNLQDLTISELWKVELATKLHQKIIIVGNLFDSLNHQDIEFTKKLLLKLSNEYNKKIIIIDNHVEVFFEVVKRIVVVKNHEQVYETSDFYDDLLYQYVKMPKIVEFVKFINQSGIKLQNHIDIYELIKDIYRVVS